ncbi:MAG: hypothetical protein AUH29_00930 [Candidatus Rokubacteria bacterium 13_1_40CM_69_27]|nr:MAG: hypothetical protein AUH29_00930 [Candidatus Rokubacteria bacterium 13_1_40CM_69_27]OLC37698.1 MAG: hypothetical protein AUH81_05550 [Candidatus Rokubacteria bacterium 13_1_40CM_4_69_5]OLE39319.1 MAG: hypothetical protein AUG00_02605 [Candidatus Rokubacteria bacterium 13_1_20CM_2_70_7]
MSSPRPSRLSRGRILGELRAAARKGDRAALTLAVDQMRTLALSPRYWEKYLVLLRNPLARLVDLLVIKQGDRIAHQKGWKKLGGGRRPPSSSEGASAAPSEAFPRKGLRRRSRHSKGRPRRPRATDSSAEQQLLFEL